MKNDHARFNVGKGSGGLEDCFCELGERFMPLTGHSESSDVNSYFVVGVLVELWFRDPIARGNNEANAGLRIYDAHVCLATLIAFGSGRFFNEKNSMAFRFRILSFSAKLGSSASRMSFTENGNRQSQ